MTTMKLPVSAVTIAKVNVVWRFKMKPVCYILVRDLPVTLNDGKAMAQVHHAGTKLSNDMLGLKSPYLIDLVDQWGDQTIDGFGTVLVLGRYSEECITDLVRRAMQDSTMLGGLVVDPTYPVDKGLTCSAMTCGYILLDIDQESDILNELKQMELHP